MKADKNTNKETAPAEDNAKKTSGKAGYIALGAGIAMLMITSALSVNFAVESNLNSAIDTAYEALDSDLIYDGVYIEEVNIGGLTKEQALERAEKDYAGPRLDKYFTIQAGSYSKDVSYTDLGASFDFKDTIDKAYSLGRSGGKAKRIENAEALSERPEYLVTAITVDKGKIKSVLKDIEKEIKEAGAAQGKMKIDILADNIEKQMLLGQSDIIFNVSFE